MDTYRYYTFVTLVLPLIISLCISVLAYGKMKRKYIKVRTFYEPDFCNTKEYKRYYRGRKQIDNLMAPLEFVKTDSKEGSQGEW